MCLCVYPSKRIHVAICGPIGTKFGTHMQIHLERVVGKKICPCDLGGTWGVLGGQKFKNLEKLPNGWTDWHQIWHTCSDLSGNGHKLKTIVPRDPRGALGRGGVRGQKLNILENLPNGWTEWHHIWHTCADSSGNGQRLKNN